MKNTLANNKQVFNVKDIAYSTTLENLAEGQVGFFAEGSNTSIAATVDTFAELPEKFFIISKLSGITRVGFDTITKSSIKNILAKAYTAQAVNIWETIVNYCDCATGFQIKINIDEDSLMRRDGLTWAHSDFVVGVTAEEIDCQCKDGVLSGYDNNIITKMAVAKVNAVNSPYYAAEAKYDVTGMTVYEDQAALTTANGSPTKGDLGVVTGEGLKQYTGSAWEVVGTVAGLITDIDSFIENSQDLNSDDVTTNDLLLTLVIKSKVQSAGLYRDLEVNYVYPRGVKISPAISVNNGAKNFLFTETQALAFEIGAGYDMRAEEFEVMSLSGVLNNYVQLSDGIASPDLVYQFENGKNYTTVSFEFSTDKVEANSGEKRNFSIILAAEAGSAEATEITNLFTA